MPLILGQERLIPGFEDHLLGLKPGESTTFEITFPDDYAETSLAGQVAKFSAEVKELREKVLPTVDDEFARSMGDYADLAALEDGDQGPPRAQRPRPGPPRVLRQDHRVRRRECHARAARHPGRPGSRGHARRVPRLAGPPGDHRGGLPQGRREDRGGPAHGIPAQCREAGQGAARALEDRRGRRSRDLGRRLWTRRSPRLASATAARRRRSRTSSRRAAGASSGAPSAAAAWSSSWSTRWLAAHPEHPAIPHLEDDAPSGVDTSAAEANAAIGATDPGSVMEADASPAAAG